MSTYATEFGYTAVHINVYTTMQPQIQMWPLASFLFELLLMKNV